MTKEEMEKRIDELQGYRFTLSMKDHWSADDFSADRKMWEEVCALKKKLAE